MVELRRDFWIRESGTGQQVAIIKKLRHLWETGDVIHGFGGETEGKRPLERPSYRWEINSKMDHQEVGWGGMDYINLAQDMDSCQAPVNAVMNEQVQPIEGNCLTSCRPGSFSGRTLLHGNSQWPITIHLCRRILETMRNLI